MTSSDRQVKIVLLSFILIHTIAVVASPLLPFIDLPNHLAEATIFKHYGEDSNSLAEYYQAVPWYYPNTLHPVFCSFFPDVEWGNKVFHVLCIALLAIAVYLVIKRVGGNPWYGLLALLFTYNYNLTYGFVGFAISIPMLFFLFYFILRDVKEDRIGTKVLISVTLVLLFLAHAQNAMLGLLLFGVLMLYTYRLSLAKLFVRVCTVPAPLIVLLFVWWVTRDKQNESSTLTYLFDYYKATYFAEFPIRFRIAVFDNFQLREGIVGIVIAAIFFVCVFIPLLRYKAWRRFSLSSLSGSAAYAFIFFIAAFGCYMILPDKLPGQTPLFQRLCTIVLITFIVCVSVLLKDVHSVALRNFVIAAVSVYSLLWIEYLYTFNHQNRDFNRQFFANTDHHSRLAGLIYDSKYRGRKVYIHYPNYFIVWRHGIAASKMIDYRFGVVRRRADETVVPFYNELISDGYRRIDTYARLDYLLVRGAPPVRNDTNVAGFTLVRESAPWQLYERKSAARE